MEEHYYYKTPNGLTTLHALHELSEEEIGDYIEITEQEFLSLQQHEQPSEAELRIMELKSLLAETDYKAIKYAEGLISEEEYAPIKAQRQEWRDEINAIIERGNEHD